MCIPPLNPPTCPRHLPELLAAQSHAPPPDPEPTNSYLFLGTDIYKAGTVGIALCPSDADSRLLPSSAATLVRAVMGGERFGGDAKETPRFVYAVGYHRNKAVPPAECPAWCSARTLLSVI